MTQRAFNLEQTAFAIDSMKEAKDHVAVMKASTAGLRTAAEDFDIGEVEDLADGAWAGLRRRTAATLANNASPLPPRRPPPPLLRAQTWPTCSPTSPR